MRGYVLTLGLIGVGLVIGCGNDPAGEPIEGRVHLGEANAEITVVLNQDPSSAVSVAEDGSFRFPEVEMPYDLDLVIPWGSDEDVLGFRGITRRTIEIGAPTAYREARIRGEAFGIPPEDHGEGELLFRLSEADGSVSTVFSPPEQVEFELASWEGPRTYEGRIVGVHVLKEGGKLRFARAGESQPFSMEDGGEVEVELTLEAPPELRSTTLAPDPGAYAHHRMMGLLWFEVLGVRFSSYGLDFEDPEVELPAAGGALRLIGMDDDGHMAQVIAPPTFEGTTELALPGEIQLTRIAPEQRAEGVSLAPRLRWTEVPGASAYQVELWGPESLWRWVVPAGVTALEVPRYPEFGVTLEAESRYTWTVSAIPDLDFTLDGQLAPAEEKTLPPWWIERAVTYSVDSFFTTGR